MEAAEADAALVEGTMSVGRHSYDLERTSVSVHQTKIFNTKRLGDAAGVQGAWSKVKTTARGAPRGRLVNISGRPHTSTTQQRWQSRSCKVCGGQHGANTCKFSSYVCRVCNQEGHLKRMCPKFRPSTGHALNCYVTERTADDMSDASDEVNNFVIHSCLLKSYDPYYFTLKVNDINLVMELDTGSTISCVSYENYLKLFADCEMHRCNLSIIYYTGESVKPVGKIKVLVTYKDTNKYLDLYVIKKAKTTLLGRQWLYELGIKIPIADCHALDSRNNIFNFNVFSSRFCDVFADGLGRFNGGTVSLRVRPDARPVFMRARPLAYALREPVERALQQLQRDGVITPVETSDWATPIVPVVKKDGTIRICGDFKITLNKCLEVDRFPLPKVEDLLVKLHGGERFSKIDLSQAYAQFVLDESSKYTVINTHKGLFKFNRLVYGLSSSPGIFQRKIESIFADLSQVGVFLDDVIITGRNDKEHISNLYSVFERLQKFGLKVKKEKCTFFEKSVTYLGYVISKHGIHTCPEKLDAINKVATPTNVTELRSFIGLVIYYARFVPNISTSLKPLYNLLQKGVSFDWDESCDKSFSTVKNKLMSSEVLTHYSPELPLVLTTDASSVGVGAVISHLVPAGDVAATERPIASASRVLNAAERSYSQIEKEALAIIFGVRKFHQYLFGRKFLLRTDHKPLVTVFGEKTGIPVMAASRMQRWAVLLSGYNYDIQYVPSARNSADALSRSPVVTLDTGASSIEKTYLHFAQKFLPVTKDDIIEGTKKDAILRMIVLYLQSGWPMICKEDHLKSYFAKRHELYFDSDCIMWGYRIIIPSSLRETILQELHVGHMGMIKMKCMARSYVWWPGIDGHIERCCRNCVTCAAESAAPPRASPSLWPYLTEPWSRLHVDFLGPIDSKSFLVIIDSSTKWIEVFYMPRTTAGATIKILRETFARFSIPKEIVSDNGPPFTSKEYADFMLHNGVKLTFSPIYHPSSNGAAENAVKLCKRAVKKAIRDKLDIDVALQSYLLAYRNVKQGTTGSSPAMLLQRRSLRTRLDLLRGKEAVENRVRMAQEKQIEYAGGLTRVFKEGDEVWFRVFGKGRKWEGGSIHSRLGSRNYLVNSESDPPVKRHIYQLKSKSMLSFPCPSPSSPAKSDKSNTSTGTAEVEPVLETETQASGLESPVTKLSQSDAPRDINNSNTNDSPPVNGSKRQRKPVKRYGLVFD